ncbi:phage tail protein [Pseudomonas flexibilis]|uniref:Phage tail protein, P2 protein I family n=1 Tax=Pseudomonas flexibilis TaxID=706570 RepID=A0A1N6YNE7_9PSED|nr:phage tail protein [Pseudomonas flexibilis]KHL70594.1 phage tail protein [Pseudomonas flexibilis]SIR15969.1 phage tail protein, P2 protein I family [Pseudomonas flexibilis]
MKIDLPVWLSGPEISKLRRAAEAWWTRAQGWLQWPLQQIDPDTCHPTILDLLAWQRDITRFNGEPENLYRLRVKHAFINSLDAGTTAGLKRVLQRLGIGYVDIEERIDGRDWDVVLLHLSDGQLSANPELLRVLVQQYGRTCRRYDFVTITPVRLHMALVDFNDDQQTLVASL